MDTVALVTGSALVTRQVVQELRDRGYIKSGSMTLLASFLINSVLAFAWGVANGAEPTVALARAIGQMALSAVYNDWKKATDSVKM